MTLATCAAAQSVPTDPNRFDMEPKFVAHLRAPQTIALINSHRAPAVVRMQPHGWSTDLMALTETATAMLRRTLEKQGISVVPEADKRIELRVLRAAAGMGGGPMMSRAIVQLGAQFRDGTRITVTADNVGFSGERALDGAVLFALNKLVNDEKFTAYVNGETSFSVICLPQDAYTAGEYLILAERMVRLERVVGASPRCSDESRPLAVEARHARDEERSNPFSHCVAAAIQAGEKVSIGPYATGAKTATIERVVGPSPRCLDPHRYPTRVEARFDDPS